MLKQQQQQQQQQQQKQQQHLTSTRMSFEEPFILMDFAFFHAVATIQVITCSQFLHSHFMEVTKFNVIYI
jgi:hypothetical protein